MMATRLPLMRVVPFNLNCSSSMPVATPGTGSCTVGGIFTFSLRPRTLPRIIEGRIVTGLPSRKKPMSPLWITCAVTTIVSVMPLLEEDGLLSSAPPLAIALPLPTFEPLGHTESSPWALTLSMSQRRLAGHRLAFCLNPLGNRMFSEVLVAGWPLPFLVFERSTRLTTVFLGFDFVPAFFGLGVKFTLTSVFAGEPTAQADTAMARVSKLASKPTRVLRRKALLLGVNGYWRLGRGYACKRGYA